MTDINNPFKYRYEEGMPGSTPEGAYEAHLAIESAVAALADYGQVRVWTLQRSDEDHISGIYVTLSGAIAGAVNITADELVPPADGDLPLEERIYNFLDKMSTEEGKKEEHQRLKYQRYMASHVDWEIIDEGVIDLEGMQGAGGYSIRTSYGDTSYDWDIVWSELMP